MKDRQIPKFNACLSKFIVLPFIWQRSGCKHMHGIFVHGPWSPSSWSMHSTVVERTYVSIWRSWRGATATKLGAWLSSEKCHLELDTTGKSASSLQFKKILWQAAACTCTKERTTYHTQFISIDGEKLTSLIRPRKVATHGPNTTSSQMVKIEQTSSFWVARR